MRVAAVIDRFRPGKGGLEAWLESLASRLRAGGDEVHLVSQDAESPPGFVHHSLAPRGLGRARRDRGFAERARDLCREEGFDVVLGLRHCLACDVYAPHGGSIAATLKAHRAAKLLPSLPSPRMKNFLALEEDLLTGPEPPRSVIAVSGKVGADLAERYPPIRERIRVVPNGVDLTRFTPAGRQGAGGVVLFVASNPRLKGFRFARDAFVRLSESGAAETLLVAGGTPGRLPPGATYLGHIERPEEVLRSADLLLHPTFYDPFPLVVLEALACGTPVVTTERNGAVEHLGREGPVRAVRDPEDVEGLVAHATELLRQAPREEARKLAEKFPLEKSLAATSEILTEAACA